MASILNITGSMVAADGSTLQINYTISVANPLNLRTGVVLAAGTNTITIPANCSVVTISPPPGNVQTLTLKGVAGDTGIPILATGTTVFMPLFQAATATFVITAGALTSGNTIITFE